MHKSVVTLGTFDGMHRGHQALMKKVVALARQHRAISVALAFDMPPRHAGKPLATPVLLTTLAEKKRLMMSLGIQRLDVLTFDRKTASTPAEKFFEQKIVRKLHAAAMIVGPKLAFGKNREGKLPLLRKLGQRSGVRIHVVPGVGKRGSVVSSRAIRALLLKGELDTANLMLGYPYSIEGTVVHGSHRGRRLGFPTANIQPEYGKILPPGVYWVRIVKPDSSPLERQTLKRGIDGICNVGYRPTFTPESRALHCEVHFMRRTPSLYGRKLRVLFMRKIRAEMKFRSADALVTQIKKDRATAQLYRNAYFSI